MTLKEFNISTFPLAIPKNSTINSDDLNSFTSAVAEDMAQIEQVLNDNIVKILNTLPSGFDKDADVLDGTSIVTDSAATATKDGGIFYNTNTSLPLTIYESMLLFMQILANMENGLREGVKVGTISSLVSTATTYPWPYTDCMFEAFLFHKSGSAVTKDTDTTFAVNSSAKTITITPSSGTYGYIWHPVLTF